MALTKISGNVIKDSVSLAGNVSIGGTLTYEDVTNIDSVGVITAREGIFLPDNKRIHLGNVSGGGDLQLYHTGSESYIRDAGTGRLRIQSSQLCLQSATGENFLVGNPDAATELYHDNNLKLSTSSTGISVTGIVAQVETGTGNGQGGIRASTASSGGNAGFGFITGGSQRFSVVTIGSAGNEALRVYDVNNSSERLRITSDGKLLVGATNQTNGSIAEFSKSVAGGAAGCHITVENTSNNSVNNTAGIHLKTSTGTAKFFKYQANQTFIQSASGGASELNLQANGAHAMRLYTNGNERLRITNSGRINIGDTDQNQNVDQLSVTVGAQNALDNVARFQSSAAASGTSETLVKIYKGAGYGGVISGYITQGSDHGLKFYTANNGSLSERLLINSNGNMGLGLTPAYSGLFGGAQRTLHIGGTAAPCLRITSSTSGQADLVVHAGNSGRRADIANMTANGSISIWTKPSSGSIQERIKISPDGYVTKPNNPAFIAGRTGGNYTHTPQPFNLNATRLNVGNHYNTSTYKFTAPVAGVYYFFAQVYYNNGTGSYRVGFRKTPNGGSAFMLTTSQHAMVGNDNQQSTSIIESLAIGDTVELYSDQNTAIQCYYNINNGNYGAHTYFLGYLIG